MSFATSVVFDARRAYTRSVSRYLEFFRRKYVRIVAECLPVLAQPVG